MAIDNSYRPGNIFKWLLRMLQGMLIGGGAILPGISGGVLCVSFGIYQPMMAVLAHPIRNVGKYWRLLLPVGLGWAFGFFVFASVVEWMFSISETVSIWLFIGLILGTVPSLIKDSKKEGTSRKASFLGVAAFALFLAYMLYIQYGGITAHITPNIGWFLFCGIMWGLSLVVPGMTSSSVLIVMGLFLPMTEGIAAMDMAVIIPMFLGVGLVVILSARIVDYLFRRYYTAAYCCIIGFVTASTLVIIPLNYSGIGEFLLCMAVAAVGFVLAWLMEKFGKEE